MFALHIPMEQAYWQIIVATETKKELLSAKNDNANILHQIIEYLKRGTAFLLYLHQNSLKSKKYVLQRDRIRIRT